MGIANDARSATCSAASEVNRVWTAELETGSLAYGTDTLYGFYNWGNTRFGTLDAPTITITNDRGFDPVSRTVKRLMQGNWFGNRSLFLGFTDTTLGINPGLTLHVGEDAYDLDDAHTGSTTYDWPIGNRAEWDENETLCVALTWNEATPPATVPDGPANVTATAGDGQVTLTWTHGWHGGSALTGHQYKRRAGACDSDADFGAWTDIDDSAPGGTNATSVTLTGLTNDVSYAFAVRAKNAEGEGAESATVCATPNNHTTPGTPRATLVSSGSGEVTVQWSAPASDGNTPILRYEYALSAAGPWTAIPLSASGQTNHGRYATARPSRTWTTVWLRAVNAEGAGPAVSRGAMSWAGAPAAPGGFAATRTGDTFTLSWTAPQPAAGASVTGFLIDRSADGRTGWSTYRIAGAGTTSITGTDAQARPWFRIRTQFRADTAVTVGGATLRFAMSAASAPVRVGEALAASGPTLRVDDATAREGTDPAMLFNVRLAPAATTTVTVDYATEDASARAGDDYTATSGTLSFAPGETRKTVSVPITDDTTEDTGETFRMRLSNAQGATIADGAATGTIWNEDHTLDRLTLADASSGTDLATLADGVSIMLANTTNGRYNVRADLTAGATADSVQLALAGVRTAHRADTGAPYTLFSDAGENLGPGSYTVVATAYRAGTALHTISTTFRVVGPNGDTGPTHPLAASLPASAATASAHTGTDGRPEVIVAFNQSVAAIAADTPSVTVAGGTLDAVRRHTEAGSANLWAFAIDPDGNGDVTFTLAAGHGCASGGICTPEGTTLSMVLARPLVIPGPSDEPAVPATLSASFTGMPEEHDTNTPFTFNVTFSEAPQVARITMKRHVWDITNGAVTEAVPTDDRSTREWRVTVRPTGASDVTIALKTTTDCAASGALCTSAGLALADPPVAVIAAAADPPTRGPLTATFGRMPAEHGGPGAGFHFDLTFSENVKTGWRKIRFWAFQVGGGTFTRVARKHPGSNIAWTISAKPNTWGDMVVTLPGGRACGQANAICTFDGERLSNTATHTIMAPASLAVADATANENDDEGLRFVVSLSRSSDLRITVDYATSDGTAAAGTDYTATSGRLTFDPGETAKTVTVALLDDAVDDGGETLTLTLSNATNARIADATATGTIENSDPLQQAWIARFGRTVANDIVDGITDRLANRDSGSQVRIAGVTLRPNGSEWTEAPIEDTEPGDGLEGHRPIETRRISTREVLAQSAFRLSGQSDAPDGAAWGAWGRFSTSSFDGETNGLTLSGDVVTGVLGADLGTEDWTVGIALSSARGDGPYKMDNDDDRPGCHSGNVDSTLTSVHPYAQVQLNPAIALWGTAGYGTGEMTVDQDRCASYKTGIDMTMAAAGLRGQILEAAAGDGFDMAVRTDALWLRTMSDEIRDLARAEADVTRLRLTIDAGRSFSAGAGTITPSLEARVRHDAGDAEEGVGFEIGAGLAYRGPGITIEGNARTLVAHDDADYREWGASGAVRIDPGTSGRGLSLTITPTWGRAASDAEQLWSTRTAEDLVGDTEFEATRRLDAEFGYGLAGPLGFGTVTPYAGVALGDGAERTLKAGARWAASHSATVVLEALRAQSGTDTAAGNAVTLRAQVRF